MALDVEALRRHMAQLPDEQLLDIVTRERQQYRPVALELAAAELRRRGLTATAANLTAQIANQRNACATFKASMSVRRAPA